VDEKALVFLDVDNTRWWPGAGAPGRRSFRCRESKLRRRSRRVEAATEASHEALLELVDIRDGDIYSHAGDLIVIGKNPYPFG
jgi:hypothetical protein